MKSSGKKCFSCAVASVPAELELYSAELRSFSDKRSASGMSENRCIGSGLRCVVCCGGRVGGSDGGCGDEVVGSVDVGVAGNSASNWRGCSVGVFWSRWCGKSERSTSSWHGWCMLSHHCKYVV